MKLLLTILSVIINSFVSTAECNPSQVDEDDPLNKLYRIIETQPERIDEIVQILQEHEDMGYTGRVIFPEDQNTVSPSNRNTAITIFVLGSIAMFLIARYGSTVWDLFIDIIQQNTVHSVSVSPSTIRALLAGLSTTQQRMILQALEPNAA